MNLLDVCVYVCIYIHIYIYIYINISLSMYMYIYIYIYIYTCVYILVFCDTLCHDKPPEAASRFEPFMDYSLAWAVGREAIALARHLYLGSRLRDQGAVLEAAALQSAAAVDALAGRPDWVCLDLRCPEAQPCPGCLVLRDQTLEIALAILSAVVLGYVLGRQRVEVTLPPAPVASTPATQPRPAALDLDFIRALGRPIFTSSDAPTATPSISSRGSSRAVPLPTGQVRLVTPKSLRNG